MSPSREIVCTACGKESLLRREAVYDGFKKVGEKLSCTACGHAFASEADVPFKQTTSRSLFSEDEAPRKLDIFTEDEKGRTCRLCKHYVVNPFTQRCALHDREVQATDICDDFTPGPEAEKTD